MLQTNKLSMQTKIQDDRGRNRNAGRLKENETKITGKIKTK